MVEPCQSWNYVDHARARDLQVMKSLSLSSTGASSAQILPRRASKINNQGKPDQKKGPNRKIDGMKPKKKKRCGSSRGRRRIAGLEAPKDVPCQLWRELSVSRGGSVGLQRQAKFSFRFQFRVKSRVLIPAFCKSGVVAGQVIKIRGSLQVFDNGRIPAGCVAGADPGR